MNGLHELTVTARRFSWFPWPTRTGTVEKTTTCEDAHQMAETLRGFGGRVVVHHVDHRPPWVEEEQADES